MSSMGSMNLTLKNNRKLLKNGKRKPFTKMNGKSGTNQGYRKYVLPKAPPHVLRRVRIKTRRYNRRLLLQQIIVGTMVTLIVVYGFYRLQ